MNESDKPLVCFQCSTPLTHEETMDSHDTPLCSEDCATEFDRPDPCGICGTYTTNGLGMNGETRIPICSDDCRAVFIAAAESLDREANGSPMAEDSETVPIPPDAPKHLRRLTCQKCGGQAHMAERRDGVLVAFCFDHYFDKLEEYGMGPMLADLREEWENMTGGRD